ncbi:hypothetical protein IQ273_12340 [Nodosilinea sp. LEGE 07298]|uniref:hypothetical protein n=1 Tax=Nodosilinea sp. LEGE 07298 TaxID=2777970 RepID=UPI001880E54D|nr:hypothetical protein [Nodosilinea sp. LEGE 07298]MBE9110201.1 hypothetical protein [Nodosilinea sp. LEGE 07298]
MGNRKFLPIFAVNRQNLLEKLHKLEGNFGVLGTIIESDKFLNSLRQAKKPYFIDSGVFDSRKNVWYQKTISVFKNGRWIRKTDLADSQEIRAWIVAFLDRCEKFNPDYVFAPDIIGEPLLSLYLARLTFKEYCNKQYSYQLIGVVQAGYPLYNWPSIDIPQADALPPYFNTAKSFLSSLMSEYRNIGYKYIALGGLLKVDSAMPMGLKFGLSNQDFDHLLSWSRPDFVLGGLALSRLDILKKHGVWADSSNWLWWDERYDFGRFGHRNALQEVLA